MVSGHAIVREGLRSLLETEPDTFEVVDAASHDGHLAGLDLVVYDLARLHDTGGEELRHLVRRNAAVLGVESGREVALTASAERLGVTAVVPVSLSGAELVAAVEAAARGRVIEGSVSHAPDDGLGLSERQLEVLAYVAQGLTNQEIAERLYIGVNTVKTYIRTAYAKIGVKSRSQAVAWYLGHRTRATGPADPARGRRGADA